jgi:hypothetical protein
MALCDTVSPSRNTLVYAHSNSRTLPTCDMGLGSLTVATSEAGDFVKSFENILLKVW